MSETLPEPRLLVVEDDAISRSFLQDALSALPAQVDAAADIAQALALVRAGDYALWLVDAHLPDGDGLDCLRALRDVSATPALAITAGVGRDELDALCAGGYLEVLLKPVSVAALHATVQRLLKRSAWRVREPQMQGKLPLWDEARALAALGGNREALDKLRTMFLSELPSLCSQLCASRSNGDLAAIQALLHKLKASCGFVGAARMLQAVNALAAAPMDVDAWQNFENAATDARDWGNDQP
jgi:CheY-like chemotaxis protein/HPt (histidine-containing phosphotransfer) domain-containing protein